jgi:hypothetical protein
VHVAALPEAELDLQRQLSAVFAAPVVEPAPQVGVAADDAVVAVAASPDGAELARLEADVNRRIAALRLRFDEAELQAQTSREEQRRVTRRLTLIIALLVSVLAGGAWWALALQRQVVATGVRLADLEQQSSRASQAASDELAATKAELQRVEASARGVSAATETMGAVLAAPDLTRYGLTAVDGSSASAQLLWSRSRGLVFSAARLGMLYPESTYQVWLLNDGPAVSAGVLTRDPSGRATLVTDTPPRVPGPVLGVSITIEPIAGSLVPSDRVVAINRIVRPTP